jgi:phenylalanyl-tRNA synthetase beta chain
VCGAPNVKAGQKVLVACVGAELFFHGKSEGLVIRRAKIRGVASEGMICAEDELGLGTSHDGIMVLPEGTPIGIPAATYFQVATDAVLEIGLTPNRTDAMSHIGVARDLVACVAFRTKQNISLKVPEIFSVDTQARLPVTIGIKNSNGCKRYTGITLAGATVGQSPAWLRNRLEAIGVKTINSVVDITNYVLHETGHPLHAFNYDALEGQKVLVQALPEGTPFTTLDGIERKLAEADLMICDAGKPLCIAGVYGGLGSGVTETTTNIFLESAWFDPVFIRRSARHHGLNTDASFRFERGADPTITPYALWRAVNLICEITGAQVASPMLDVGEFADTPWSCTVQLRMAALDSVAGQHITPDEVHQILHLLGFVVVGSDSPGVLNLAVPGYRADVTREIDVIEEVLRIYGFDQINIPESIPVSFPVTSDDKARSAKSNIAGWLIHNGFNEVWNNSLASSAFTAEPDFSGRLMKPVRILNPLSQELDVMRTSLLPGLLENARHNLNRKISDFRLFEFGFVYSDIATDTAGNSVAERYFESPVLALIMTGSSSRESWLQPQKPSGFFDMKNSVVNLLRLAGYHHDTPEPEGCEVSPSWVGAVCFRQGNVMLARMGQVSPTIARQFGIKQDVWYAEINWHALSVRFMEKNILVEPLSRYPDVRRDLSMVVDEQTSFDAIRRTILDAAPQIVSEVNLFDVYEGKNLPVGRKSYAVSVTLKDTTKTLHDQEIDDVMQRIIQRLDRKIGAVLR